MENDLKIGPSKSWRWIQENVGGTLRIEIAWDAKPVASYSVKLPHKPDNATAGALSSIFMEGYRAGRRYGEEPTPYACAIENALTESRGIKPRASIAQKWKPNDDAPEWMKPGSGIRRPNQGQGGGEIVPGER